MSIWKTPDQKPERTGDIVYVLEDGDFGNFFYIEGNNFPTVVMANQFCFVTEDTPIKMVKWTYLAELIAQANKAERLQKAVGLALISLGTAAVLDRKYVKKYTDAKIDLIKKLTQENK